jgi:nicotinamidase-related amidase
LSVASTEELVSNDRPGRPSGDGGGDVLLVVDLFDDFSHDDGGALLNSLADRRDGVAAVLTAAREASVPVVFANDNRGVWDGEASALIGSALAGPGGPLLHDLIPVTGDTFVIKPRYSAFDHTPLALILADLGCDRLVVAGMTTEGCVAQSAIAARELGLKVTVVADACASANARDEETALRYLVDVVGVKLDDCAHAFAGMRQR